MWQDYFNLLKPHFIVPGIGEFQADNPNLNPDKLWQAYQRGCKSVQITDKGKEKYMPEPVKPTKNKKHVENTNMAEPTE